VKYCSKCGASIQDDAAFCTKCGQPVDGNDQPKVEVEPVRVVKTTAIKRDSALMNVAFILAVISCVLCAFAIIPLAWMIPMTVSMNDKIKNNEEISVAFKVCTLIFVNTISGILLLVGDEN